MNMGKYDDILDMPRPESFRRKMTPHDRAAQFAPFAALTGYGDEISEAERTTRPRAELCDDAREMIDRQISSALALRECAPRLDITYFVPDKRKQGGAYMKARGRVVSFDEFDRTITLSGGEAIPVYDIYDVAFLSD